MSIFGSTSRLSRRDVLAGAAALGAAGGAPVRLLAADADTLTWGVHISLAPVWFDPAEVSGLITPFLALYALHDAMVKPMPGQQGLTPSLAESVTASEDGLTYDFVLRKNAKFHTGDPMTAEDVKFSFDRYHGAANDMIKGRVAAVETPDPLHVRFKLKNPWPDFLTFYATARRSAPTGSKRRRSGLALTNSRRSTPASSWCSKRSPIIGARRRR
jgi:peptide/nickel transport system substrate-binding protein